MIMAKIKDVGEQATRQVLADLDKRIKALEAGKSGGDPKVFKELQDRVEALEESDAAAAKALTKGKKKAKEK